jgi:hypothetical protein
MKTLIPPSRIYKTKNVKYLNAETSSNLKQNEDEINIFYEGKTLHSQVKKTYLCKRQKAACPLTQRSTDRSDLT